ncbi:hypothetical protein RD792_016754 [Penstemon davidsonii]|uniref:Proline dehydrogenase n=1 Tax=Penstemon davidsonii TaxID=160366 RepID=A0ABR0CK95_9LAMI|nr:hypothetical protein RD792_016754 [Penstemon davidsonii]
MASQKLPHNLSYFFRRLNSTVPSYTTTAVPPLKSAGKPTSFSFLGNSKIPISPLPNLEDSSNIVKTAGKPNISSGKPNTATDPVLNLHDSEKLFSSVSTPKLIKSSITLQLASAEPMVDFGMWVMNSKFMEIPIIRKMILDVIEYTFYEHFCAGKNLKEADKTVKRLWDGGLRAMLDYGLEHANDNDSCERNLDEFIQTIESTQTQPISPVSFVVVKITAICPPILLKRISDLLRWEYKDTSLHLPWKLKTFQIFANSSPLYHTTKRPKPLTIEEERDFQLAYQRLTKICQKSLQANIPLLIDAEDTAIQPAIDYFTYSAAIQYHKDDEPLIFNTIQAYLKDAKERLVIAKRDADKMNVPIGFKLVRGAYMSSERKLASCLGVESPIHEGIQNTHACFNECADFMLHEIANGSGSVVLATHNIQSGKLAAATASNLGIERDNPKLQFAQLYGMAETLSFGLKNAGFRVSKYLPFGPVDQIMPYLLRRAEENRGLLATSSLDRQMIR